jgi:hypothetical protein
MDIIKLESVKVIIHKYWPVLFFLLLTLIILWQLLLPGYLFFLDYQPFPKPLERLLSDALSFTSIDDTRGLFWGLIHLPSYIFGLMLGQKVILFLLIFFTGYLMYRFVPFIKDKKARVFAGLFYVLNPFVYFRLASGQIGVIFGYAMLPLLIKLFLDYFEDDTKIVSRNAFFIGIILLFLTGSPLHFFAMFLMIIAPILWIYLFFKNSDKKLLLKKSIFFALIILLMNSFWIGMFFTGKTSFVSEFDVTDQVFFSTRALNDFNPAFGAFSLHGFWHEAYPKGIDQIPIFIWFPLFILFLFAVVDGFRECTNKLKWPLAAIAIVSLIFAIGISSVITQPIFQFFFDNIPFFKGFREPGKFIAVLAFFYAIFSAYFVQQSLAKLKFDETIFKNKQNLLIGLTLILLLVFPFIYSNTMLLGINSFIQPREIPQEYWEAKEIIDADKNDYKILFLPYYNYIKFIWTDYKTANPFRWFFEKETYAGYDSMGKTQYDFSNNLNQILGLDVNLNEVCKITKTKYLIVTKPIDFTDCNKILNNNICIKVC